MTILLEGKLFVTLPRWAVTMEGDTPYESWTGYSRWNGIIYEEYQMNTEQIKLFTNK